MGGAILFLLGGGQGAGHVGADISYGRALDECMDDKLGGSWGGQGHGTGGAAAPPPPLAPPVLCGLHWLRERFTCSLDPKQFQFVIVTVSIVLNLHTNLAAVEQRGVLLVA